VTELLAQSLAQAGHEVSVVTNQPGPKSAPSAFQLVRRPRWHHLASYYRQSDAIILQGPVLRLACPLLWRRHANVLMVHHMPVSRKSKLNLRNRFAERLARRSRHACVSRWLSGVLPWPIESVLPNLYNDSVFRPDPSVTRARDIIFVGRLIPEKGASVLIESVSLLKKSNDAITLTVAGDGCERQHLQEMVTAYRLNANVAFAGQVTAAGLASLLRQHHVLAVPSLMAEAFGLVTLEGLACGCKVVVSDTGGLSEALGHCGTAVACGNACALAAALGRALLEPGNKPDLEQHLAKHRPKAVAKVYLEELSRLRSWETEACGS
jgi:glycogen synthase